MANCWKTIPLPLETLQWPIIKPWWSLGGPWGWRNLKNDKKIQKSEKKKFYQNFAKICNNKMMETIPWPIKIFSTLLSNAIGDFLAPGSRKT